MAVPSLEIARKIVDISVSRKEILSIVSGITPAKMAEVINHLNVVEMMMGMQKMRARKVPGNQAHITNLKDDPVQIAADAAEGALRGFREEETTMGVARYAPDWLTGRQERSSDSVLCRRGHRAGTGNPWVYYLRRDAVCIWNRESLY